MTPSGMPMLAPFLQRQVIAYFSMEVAFRSDVPTYSGGLGVLAGDMLRSAADLNLPMVGVTLISRRGYFRQTLGPGGEQGESPDPWDPAQQHCQALSVKVCVTLEGRNVWVCAWLHVMTGHQGDRLPLLLLDTDLPENDASDRELTHYLYGGDAAYRLKQEAILGVGGIRILQTLGFRVRKHHMNEGHAALLALELLRTTQAAPGEVRPGESPFDFHSVRTRCDFTTHTPISAGRDEFDYTLVNHILGDFIDGATLRALGGSDRLDMSRLAMNLSGFVNGVAKRHAETSRGLFPGYVVRAVTNGVHPLTWVSPSFAELFDRRLLGWRSEPELLVRIDCCVESGAVWDAHAQAKALLIQYVRNASGQVLHPTAPILGFARRITSYKRPELLFSDLKRLRAIARRMPFQVVLAGKAHPRDFEGKLHIERLHLAMHELAADIPCVFLPNYSMEMAQHLVAGVDIWLNTPQPPLEASGTSGMKAAMNGVPSLSVLDGWWAEGCIEGVTGWAIGDGKPENAGKNANDLYEKLETSVLPLYYNEPAGWRYVMKSAISRNAPLFNSHRTMRRYASEAYL